MKETLAATESDEDILEDIIRRADVTKSPEDQALARTKAEAYFASHPDAMERNGNLARRCVEDLIQKVAPYTGAAIREFVDSARHECGYSQSPFFERVCIDASLAHHLRSMIADMRADECEDPATARLLARMAQESHREFSRYSRLLAYLRRRPISVVMNFKGGVPGDGLKAVPSKCVDAGRAETDASGGCP